MFKAQNWYRFRDESKVDGLRESNWTVLRIGNEWSKGMEIEIWAPKLLILKWKLRGPSSLTLTCDRPVWRSPMTLHFRLDSLITVKALVVLSEPHGVEPSYDFWTLKDLFVRFLAATVFLQKTEKTNLKMWMNLLNCFKVFSIHGRLVKSLQLWH